MARDRVHANCDPWCSTITPGPRAIGGEGGEGGEGGKVVIPAESPEAHTHIDTERQTYDI